MAWLLGSMFSRFGLPVMLGELLAGLILGPPLLGIIQSSPSIDIIAEFGIFFVMFHTGMEMDPEELLEHIWSCLAVALGGFILPFFLGYVTTRLFGGTFFQSLFVGLGVSVTAIAVQAAILNSMRINKSELGHIILGAAIANDIFALIAFSVLLGFVETGTVQVFDFAIMLVKVVAFFSLTILMGQFVLPRVIKPLTSQKEKAFTFAMISACVMAYLAELAGLHLIIGAFLAGQLVRKEIPEHTYKAIIGHMFAISYGFLVPIFFASLSFHLHFHWNVSFVLFALVIIIIAVVGKWIGCAMGAALFGYNSWESSIIGFGMNGRGAVELVIASVVIKLSDQLMESQAVSHALLTQEQFSALVLMAFVTTFIGSISLKWAVERTCLPMEKAAFCKLWDKIEEDGSF